MYEQSQVNGTYADSARQEIVEYLSPPTRDMKFIDLGCCLNLMFRGYDSWPSEYYGVDISKNDSVTKRICCTEKFVHWVIILW